MEQEKETKLVFIDIHKMPEDKTVYDLSITEIKELADYILSLSDYILAYNVDGAPSSDNYYLITIEE